MGDQTTFPALPLEQWRDTKTTLHLFTQIVGKIRLGLHPKQNHWWHVPLYISSRGLTTRSIPHRGRNFELEFDFIKHHLAVRTSDGDNASVPLGGTSVAGFYRDVMQHLRDFGIEPIVVARPFDPDRVGSNIPFEQDTQHNSYDPQFVEKFWRILVSIEPVFNEFRGRYVGKCSPVHFFWHSFDLAVTRFSGRDVEVAPDADPVTREAYSHEVISAGFWPGDNNVPEPAFYAYTAPEPAGLAQQALAPGQAWWQDVGGSHMAMYRYDDFRSADDPTAALLEFLQSSYEAGAKLAGWPEQFDGGG
jgi:hypothetical protein